MSVTIKELAANLKISPATVSLALNNDKRVAAKTVQKIKELASELNYIPNNFGRGLQSKRSHLIGYLLDGVASSFYNELLQGIGERCSQKQYGLLTGIISKNPESLRDQIILFLEKNIDGLILSLQVPNEIITLLEKHGVPFVFCSASPHNSKHVCVKNNDYEGGRMAAQHLLELGHCYFACNAIQSERLAGNISAIEENGCRYVLFESAEEIGEIMTKEAHPTAIISYSDIESIKIRHILTEHGLQVPEDVSLVGTDDLWFAALPEFSFTTIAQAKKRIGVASVEILLDKINGQKVENTFLTPELIIRASTAKPNNII